MCYIYILDIYYNILCKYLQNFIVNLYTLVLYDLKVFFYFLLWKFLVCAIRNCLADEFWNDQKVLKPEMIAVF